VSIKKTRISKESLPPLSPNGEYILRYRIISEDKNRTSHWSPIYYIDAKPTIEQVSGELQASASSLGVTAIWGDTNLKSLYDVFVSFGIYNNGTSQIDWAPYFFHGSSPIHTYSFLRNSEHTDIRVKIQLSGVEKNVNNILTICTLEKSLR
jgi:hypothetical protein